jgi:two-component system, cell cycle response regulator
MRVLIAEDSAVARRMIQSVVESIGHECLLAEDGAKAWDLFQASEVDVIISDWIMPEIEGPELCQRVRELAGRPYTYFILLTALEDKQHALAGIRAGADDYLTKPLDIDELQLRLIGAARVTALHRQLAAAYAELAERNRELFAAARVDPLTGLGNRRRLQEDLVALQNRIVRYGHSYAVALCDLDHFKGYNDHHGHQAGDAALAAVGRALIRACREGDGVYRYGGEEFLVLLAEQTPAGAAVAAERIRRVVEALAIPHVANPPSGVMTVSIGIASLQVAEPLDPDQWVKRADAALYAAKAAGRNCVVTDDQCPTPAT